MTPQHAEALAALHAYRDLFHQHRDTFDDPHALLAQMSYLLQMRSGGVSDEIVDRMIQTHMALAQSLPNG